MTRIELTTGPIPVFAVQVGTLSLGDHSYVVVVGDRAVVVDPQRDVDRFEEVLADLGTGPVAIVETHIHNDYVSGGALLARRHGAAYVLPANSGGRMDHVAVADAEHVEIGAGWRLRAVHTPGHTPHHMSYVLTGPDGDAAVFTGGSMLVGAVGRSDLVSPELTIPLARLQYESVNYLARTLPDPVVVGPTHGTGSFCSASNVLATTSTIGEERTRNPALLADDEASFVTAQIAGYRLFPSYYAHMGPANLEGGDAIPTEPVPDLDAATMADPETAFWIVDVRPAGDFAAGHVPGAINIPFSNDTATYAGWILGWNEPVVLFGDDAAQIDEVRLQLARIGFDRIVGVVTNGLETWGERPIRSYRVADFAAMAAAAPSTVLDTRDPKEVEEGTWPGAVTIHVSRLEERMNELPETELWVFCASGYRASIAASILQRHGREAVLVVDDVANMRPPAVDRAPA